MKQILAVINFWPGAERLLKKAREVAVAINAKVYVYCPVSSQIEELNRYVGFENFEDVKAELIDECKSRLEALPGIEGLETEVEWQSQAYMGVASKAEAISAAMVIIGSSEHNLLGDLLHKPDDWHLLRDSRCPVLILNREHKPYHAVIAAVDAMADREQHSALNARILDEAVMMSELLKLPLKVVTVVPEPAYIYSEVSATDSLVLANFRDEAVAMASEKQQQMLQRLGVKPHSAVVVLGRVERELQSILAESGLLVIGTIANKGVKGFFIGNTCDRLLSNLKGDMLVVN